MISYWFLSALITTLSIGLVSFLNKIIVEKKYDQNLCAISFYFTQVVLYFILLLLFGNKEISYQMIFFGFLWGIIDFLYLKCRFLSLQSISSSLFFINTRLFSSSFLLIIGIFLFGDSITVKEFIGFIIGFVVFFLLFEKERTRQMKYKNGLLFLAIGIIILTLGHFLVKYITTILENIFLLFLSFAITGLFFSMITNKKKISFKDKNFSDIIKLNILHALLFFFYIYFLFNTYYLADLGIAYKIQSYSIFIPIFLSIIIYDEKINTKKLVAFLLTILSLWFFI